jgi:hypothetical protein
MPVDWDNVPKVEPPPATSGYIGWGRKPGQHVTGKVTAYDPTGGTDFGGKVCPHLEVELAAPAASFNKKLEQTKFDTGETVSLTCGTYELRRAVLAAEPEVGDDIRIVMDGEEDLEGGNTIKRFSLQLVPAKKKPAAKAAGGKVPAADDDDQPPF